MRLQIVSLDDKLQATAPHSLPSPLFLLFLDVISPCRADHFASKSDAQAIGYCVVFEIFYSRYSRRPSLVLHQLKGSTPRISERTKDYLPSPSPSPGFATLVPFHHHLLKQTRRHNTPQKYVALPQLLAPTSLSADRY